MEAVGHGGPTEEGGRSAALHGVVGLHWVPSQPSDDDDLIPSGASPPKKRRGPATSSNKKKGKRKQD